MKPLFDIPSKTVVQQPSIVIDNDTQQIVTMKPQATQVAVVTDDQISTLGDDHYTTFSGVSKKILSSVKASDADEMGMKLNELVTLSKDLDPNKLSKPGLIGKVVGLFSNTKERLLSQFDTVDGRMNSLVKELDSSVVLFKDRVDDFEDLFGANKQAFDGFVKCEEQARAWLADLQAAHAQCTDATDAFSAQVQADLLSRIDRVEKRIDDYIRLQQSTKMLAATIRLSQDNSRSLYEKFREIKNTIIPTWQNVFSIYIMSLEQKKGAALATAMHDATDEAFKMQASMLRQNTVAVAQARQRSAISTDALVHAQQELIGSVEDVKRINADARKQREADLPKILALEQELIQRLTSK